MTRTDTPLRKLVLNEAHAYAVFADGHVEDRQFAVSLVCKELPQNITFNRAYVLDPGVLTSKTLEDISGDFVSVQLSFQVNIFLPISDEVEELLRQNNFRVTSHLSSEMALTKPSAVFRGNQAVEVKPVSHDLIETFTDTLLQAYSAPSNLIQPFRSTFCRTIPPALEHEGVALYLAYLGENPVGTLYLFSEGSVGGIYNVGVVKDARRHGVATMLMLRAIEDSRAVGNSTLCLQTRANSFQERFYGHLGFEGVARRNRVVPVAGED